MKNKKIKSIYFAAALFNARETVFNSLLVEALEKKGYKVNFPQRDGFEFSKLQIIVNNRLANPVQRKRVVDTIIYLLDMGKFLPESEVVIANLDEPLDEGLVVEITAASFMEIPVVGFRTDVRSPYGNLTEDLRGMHFFPPFQCDVFVSAWIDARTPKNRKSQVDDLANKLVIGLKNCKATRSRLLPTKTELLIHQAETLFAGIDDIHSTDGMEIIVERVLNGGTMDDVSPLIIR